MSDRTTAHIALVIATLGEATSLAAAAVERSVARIVVAVVVTIAWVACYRMWRSLTR